MAQLKENTAPYIKSLTEIFILKIHFFRHGTRSRKGVLGLRVGAKWPLKHVQYSRSQMSLLKWYFLQGQILVNFWYVIKHTCYYNKPLTKPFVAIFSGSNHICSLLNSIGLLRAVSHVSKNRTIICAPIFLIIREKHLLRWFNAVPTINWGLEYVYCVFNPLLMSTMGCWCSLWLSPLRSSPLLRIVQALRGFSVHFWKKLPFFAQMISSKYSFDPDIAQSILTRLTYNNNISRIGGLIWMILSYVICLMKNWQNKNIFEIIYCQGHLMFRGQNQN